jgi:yecA family protein
MTRNPAQPDFDDLANLFTALGGLQSPSEVHGYMTGQLAAGYRLSSGDWLGQLNEFCDFRLQPQATEQSLLDSWLRSTARALSGDALDFSLLLPDDDDGIADRVACLGHWCQGFLAGFALAGQQIRQTLGAQQYSEDISEAINDIAAIAQIGLDEEDDAGLNDESSEMAFIEVSEHVRLAALSIFIECNGCEDNPPAANNPADDASLLH